MNYGNSNNFSVEASFILNTNKNIDEINYNLIEFPLPGYSNSGVTILKDTKQATIPGDTITKDEIIQVRFILDEKMKVFFNLKKIMEENAIDGMSNIILSIIKYDNNHKPIVTAKYTDVWIANISSTQYLIQGDDTTLYLDCSLGYNEFIPNEF